jgi:anti-anti-sigma regulatory factor
VNFHGAGYFGSTGFAVLFKLVSRARADGRDVKFCDMKPDMRLGAEIVGLEKVVEIYENDRSALAAFVHA